MTNVEKPGRGAAFFVLDDDFSLHGTLAPFAYCYRITARLRRVSRDPRGWSSDPANTGDRPMRYFFHVKYTDTMFDEEGLEFDKIEDVREEAIISSAEMIRNLRGENFWRGDPWVLWVTDQPNGGGNTLLTLTFNARVAA
jgi:hypothetical protein